MGTAAFLVMVIVVSACGGDGDDEATGQATVVSSTTSTSEAATTSTGEETTTTTAAETASTAAPTTTEEVGGDFFDIGPRAGEPLDVVSVRFDDVLNFRVLPDAGADIVDTAAPLSSQPVVLSQGEGRLFPSSAWWKVTVGGLDAWANFTFLGMLGNDADIFADLAPLEAATVDDLVAAVVAARTSPPPEPRVTIVRDVEEVAGGNQEIVVDIANLGDDALKGERVTLEIEPLANSVRLVAATATAICGRGVSNGLCA